MPRRPDTRQRVGRIAALVVATVVLGACATGERPSFETVPGGDSAPASTDDTGPLPQLTAFLDVVDTPVTAGETVTYEVVQSSQHVEATATLLRDSGRTALDVRGTRFREIGGTRQTCELSTGACTDGYAEERLSDLQVTTGFWGPSLRQSLTSPALAAKRIGPITTASITVAGQTATCISIPGPDRTDRYCVLPSGVLAGMDTAFVRIELTNYSPSFDEGTWSEVPSS